MHNHTFCALPSKTFTKMGVLWHCSARQYPEHAQGYGTLSCTKPSPVLPHILRSLTFMLTNTALAEELHCKEENSLHTPVTALHEILPLPQQAPSKNIQVYHTKERTVSGSPKRQSEVPPKNQSSFSKKALP